MATSANPQSDWLRTIPQDRIWQTPCPGTATEADAINAWDHQRRICELVDGTLVEKSTGIQEGFVNSRLGFLLLEDPQHRDLGYCIASNGMIRTAPRRIRIPDLAFFS